MRLLSLTQIESGRTFYVQPTEICSIDPVARMRPASEVVIGEDNVTVYTQLLYKNGAKAQAKETPEEIVKQLNSL